LWNRIVTLFAPDEVLLRPSVDFEPTGNLKVTIKGDLDGRTVRLSRRAINRGQIFQMIYARIFLFAIINSTDLNGWPSLKNMDYQGSWPTKWALAKPCKLSLRWLTSEKSMARVPRSLSVLQD
jgi:hypothetical protein